MAIDIYAVHMEPSTASDHEHIAAVRWRNSDDSAKTGENATQQIVDWLRASTANVAYAFNGFDRVQVGVVDTAPPHLRTYADGDWTNNLLALPRF